MGNPVGHFEILGSNPAQLRDFYTGIFGWSVKRPIDEGDPREYAMISTNSGEESIEGGIGRAMQGGPGINFYIDVEDLGSTLAAVEAAGGRVVMPPMQVAAEGVHIALFSDPEGNVLGLVKE